MNYDVNYFIKKFEAIPAENWIRLDVGDDEDGPHCALGHCGVRSTADRNDWVPTEEAMALIRIFNDGSAEDSYGCIRWSAVYNINDDQIRFSYPGSNPKERILNQLYKKRDQG